MGGRGSSSGRGAKGGGGGKISSQGLPQLNGTEKQVAWANDIRQQYISSFNGFLESLQNPTNNDLIGSKIRGLQYIEPFLRRIIGREKTEELVDKSSLTKDERKKAIENASKQPESLQVTNKKGQIDTVTVDRKQLSITKARASKNAKLLAGVSSQFQKGIAEKTEAKWWIEHRPY